MSEGWRAVLGYEGTYEVSDQGARLTEDQVAEIKALAGTLSRRRIGERFGIDQAHLSQIVNGKIWRHVQPREPHRTTAERAVTDGRTR